MVLDWISGALLAGIAVCLIAAISRRPKSTKPRELDLTALLSRKRR